MFPPSVPHYFIDKYSVSGDTVLDPFSGRGTTILEACFMGRKAIGNDRNPLAYLLTKAKCDVPQKGRIISKINKLEGEFDSTSIDIGNIDPNIRMIFSDYTLKQLEFLKNRLKWKVSNVDTFIAAMVIGQMHGNSIGYMSLRMPNTFSMSPNYVRNYISKHKLTRPERDVFKILRSKLERCYQRPIVKGTAYISDAMRLSRIKDSSIDLVVTSPPYTRVIRYGQYNWIRLWFLGADKKEVDNKLFFSESCEKYATFMQSVLIQIKRVLKPNGKAVLVIGDVRNRSNGKIFNLAEFILERAAKPLGFSLAEPIVEDIVSDDTKVTKIWGDRKGNATKIDRILILQK